MRSATPAQSSRPVSTIASCTTRSAVSRPVMPFAAAAHSVSLASTGCGAWSVATQSMVPSASPRRSASTSALVRSGGLTLNTVSYSPARSSVSSRWCGVTSAVTRQPLDLAQRTISTEPAVETWQTCSRDAGVRGEQAVARDDRLLGGGRPAGQAEPAGDLTLVQLGAFGEPRLLGVLRDHPVERLHVLQGPAHQQRVGDAVAVVGEHPDRARPSRPSRRAPRAACRAGPR